MRRVDLIQIRERSGWRRGNRCASGFDWVQRLNRVPFLWVFGRLAEISNAGEGLGVVVRTAWIAPGDCRFLSNLEVRLR